MGEGAYRSLSRALDDVWDAVTWSEARRAESTTAISCSSMRDRTK